MTDALDVLAQLCDPEPGLHAYRDDLVGFAVDVLGERPWAVQERILRALIEHRKVAVPSCFASGKSWTAARAVMGWVASDPEAIAVTTAPTWRQVETILWGEIRKAWVPDLPGKMSPRAPEWLISPRNWARGLSTDYPARFQGYHEGRVLVVMDEAAGVDAVIYDAMEGLLAGGDTAALLIGNPEESAGPFYDRCASDEWEVIGISAFDTPNFTSGAVVNPKLVTPEWVEGRRREWGEDSPMWQSKVLGQFPDAGERIIVALSWFDRASRSSILAPSVTDVPVMGLDIARFGTDDSAVVIRSGPMVLHLERRHGADGVQVAGWAGDLARRHGVSVIHGDSAGLGGPVLDVLRHNGLNVVDVNAGEAASDPEHYTMRRDELWWSYRTRFRDGHIALPDSLDRAEVAKLRAQSTALRYGYDVRGRIKVESKAEAAKRGIPSPDLADAACLAFWSPPGASSYLRALTPSCACCGTPNLANARACSGCGSPIREAS
ncbi:MAG: hypothetical protein ACYDAD_11690 [Acidimicrobiales bacterium]